MADLADEITSLQAEFQHIADLHPWVCLAMPPWGKVGVPIIGELVEPFEPPPEPPGKIVDASGQPIPASKPSLLEKAEYAKAVRSIRFSDKHGCDRDASIEEFAKVIQNLESPTRFLDLHGPPPWVMRPEDPSRRQIVAHVDALTWKADRLLFRVLDGPNQILGDVPEQIREQNKECPLLGWIRWLRYSVTITGPNWRIENYPQAAATALMELRDVVGVGKMPRKRGSGKPPLEKSNSVKFQVYDRIQREHTPGAKYRDTLDRVKGDKDFVQQVKDANLKLNTDLVRKVLAFFDQRKRSARKNQETDSV